MPTDKKLNQLIINKLTAEQYAGIESPDPEQLYFVPDETDESLPPQAPEDKGKALLANGDGTASWKGVANAESANDWKEPQTFSGGVVADEIKSKSTGNVVAKTEKDSSGAWGLTLGSSARPTKVEGTEVDVAGALKAKADGSVEVGKDLEVDGNLKKGFIGMYTLPVKNQGATVATLDCFVFEGIDGLGSNPRPVFFSISYADTVEVVGVTRIQFGMLYTAKDTPLRDKDSIASAYIDIDRLFTTLNNDDIEMAFAINKYSTDSAGNVTINDVLHVSKDGKVEVGKDLEVDGNIVKGYAGIYHLPVEGGGQVIGQIDVVVMEGMDDNGRPVFFTFSHYGRNGLVYSFLVDDEKNLIHDSAKIPSSHIDTGFFTSIVDENGLPPTQYQHTVTLANSAGGILFTQTLASSKNTIVDSYQDLNTLFGGALYGGNGTYAQLDLRGGTVATDKLVKQDGTSVTLASLGAITYSDDCFVPK